MPAGRPNRPLFDLIAEDGDEARRRTSPASVETPAVELKPPPASRPRDSVSLVDRSDPSVRSRPAPRGLWGSLVSTGRATIEVTTPWFAACVAVLLAILLGTWIIAYKVGESDATRRLAGGTSVAPPRAQPSASDTLAGPAASGARTTDDAIPIVYQTSPSMVPRMPVSERQDLPEEADATNPGLPEVTPGDSGSVVAYNGTFASDPRVVGQNYLVLASNMTRQDARSAVDFLGQNGFRALGVPYGTVDRSSRPGKNDPLYKLVSAQGFDSSEMKESQARREQMADEVRRLGQIYQRQHRGKYNFAKVNWEKYVR